MNESWAMEQDKMFVSPICDKELTSKIYRNSYNPTDENQIPTLKLGKGLIRHFCKDSQMTNRYMKSHSTSSVA